MRYTHTRLLSVDKQKETTVTCQYSLDNDREIADGFEPRDCIPRDVRINIRAGHAQYRVLSHLLFQIWQSTIDQ